MKIYILIFSLFVGCGASKDLESKKSDSMKVTPLYETLVESAMGGYSSPQIKVIKEQNTLLEIYGQVNKTRKPGFPIPTVNFEKETIVAVFLGQKNTGGFSVSVNEIVEKDGKLFINVKETKPDKGSMATMVFTQPFCIIKLNNTDKELVFKKVK